MLHKLSDHVLEHDVQERFLLFDSSENICLPYLTSTHLSG